MNPIDRIRGAASRMVDVLREQQRQQFQREAGQPNGQIRQADDPDRQLQEQQARLQREQQQRQEQAQREAAQRGEL